MKLSPRQRSKLLIVWSFETFHNKLASVGDLRTYKALERRGLVRLEYVAGRGLKAKLTDAGRLLAEELNANTTH